MVPYHFHLRRPFGSFGCLLLASMFLCALGRSGCEQPGERARETSTAREPGIGDPVTAWYFSLKTSKGYCGLVPAPAAAGGYGFAIVCNNKAPQYGSQFTVLLPETGKTAQAGRERTTLLDDVPGLAQPGGARTASGEEALVDSAASVAHDGTRSWGGSTPDGVSVRSSGQAGTSSEPEGGFGTALLSGSLSLGADGRHQRLLRSDTAGQLDGQLGRALLRAEPGVGGADGPVVLHSSGHAYIEEDPSWGRRRKAAAVGDAGDGHSEPAWLWKLRRGTPVTKAAQSLDPDPAASRPGVELRAGLDRADAADAGVSGTAAAAVEVEPEGEAEVEEGAEADVTVLAETTAAAAVAGRALADPSAPIIVTSGTPVRLLVRSAGLCNTPPVMPPPTPSATSKTAAVATAAAAAPGGFVEVRDRARGHWLAAAAQRAARTLARATRAICCVAATSTRCGGDADADPGQGLQPRDDGVGGGSVGGIANTSPGTRPGSSWLSGWLGLAEALLGRVSAAAGCYCGGQQGELEEASAPEGLARPVGDLPYRAVICSLGQPSALSYRVFKADLKEGQQVDLAKDWVYLMEGDKFCTITDVAGLSAAISCHLDSPGWSAYKFALQPMSYPRSQLWSLLTQAPCGVRLPALPPPHDVQCQAGALAGRAPEVDLVLQTPGSALTPGVVVGFSTFSPGLLGTEQQRCCAGNSSPHFLFCESPGPGTVAGECWFQMYDVKLSSKQLGGNSTAGGRGPNPPGRLVEEEVQEEEGWSRFWHSCLRALAAEMAPDGMAVNPPATGRGLSKGLDAGRDADVGVVAGGSGSSDPRVLSDADIAGLDAGEPGLHPYCGEGFPDNTASGHNTHNCGVPDASASLALTSQRSTGEPGVSGGVASSGGIQATAALITGFKNPCYSKAPGGLAARLAGAAPLGDGSLVMLYSRTFGRYCSVSIDGTLLCVSAQASNASRNLFTLAMPPLPQPGDFGGL